MLTKVRQTPETLLAQLGTGSQGFPQPYSANASGALLRLFRTLPEHHQHLGPLPHLCGAALSATPAPQCGGLMLIGSSQPCWSHSPQGTEEAVVGLHTALALPAPAWLIRR